MRTETSFFTIRGTTQKSGVYLDTVEAFLDAEDFDERFRQIQREAAATPEAVQIESAYLDALQAEIQHAGMSGLSERKMTDFTCGIRICTGRFVDPDGIYFKEQLQALLKASKLPYFAVMTRKVQSASGTETRFLFTTHPESRGIAVHLTPR